MGATSFDRNMEMISACGRAYGYLKIRQKITDDSVEYAMAA